MLHILTYWHTKSTLSTVSVLQWKKIQRYVSEPDLHLSSVFLLPDVSSSFFSLSSWGYF